MGKVNQELNVKKINDDLVKACLESKYNLVVYSLHLLPGGTSSAAWVADTNAGKYLAKVFGLGEGSVEWVTNEAELFYFLRQRGVCAPEVLPSASGELVSVLGYQNNRFPVTVVKWQEALRMLTPATITLEELTSLGTKVSQMHLALRDYPDGDFIQNRPRSSSSHHKPTTAFEAVMAGAKYRKIDAKLLNSFEAIDQQMELYVNAHPPLDSLPKSVIHADLSLDHAQLLPNGDIYFFDFSDRKWGTRSQEIATFFTTLYLWEDISFKKLEELQSHFLVGYQVIYPVSSEELSAIPSLMVKRLLGTIKYLANLANNYSDKNIDEWIMRGFKLGKYLSITNVLYLE